MEKFARIRAALIFCVVGIAILFTSGCATPGHTDAEVRRRHEECYRLDRLFLGEDFQLIMLLDKPTRLSPTLNRYP